MTATTDSTLRGAEQQVIYKRATSDICQKLEMFLQHLPKETANNLRELFAQYESEDNRKTLAEIAGVIRELLFPESLLVDVRKEFELDHEDKSVRARLNDYRARGGRNIKKRREALHMTQGELADKAGIPQSHVSRLETGKHVPTHLTIEKLAEALGTTPSQIDPGFDE